MVDRIKWFNKILILPMVVFVAIVFWHKTPTKNIMSGDAMAYYVYLPAIFEHSDLNFNFLLDRKTNWQSEFRSFTGFYPESWFVSQDKNGNKINFFTSGVSIVYLPMYIITRIFTNDGKGFGPVFHYSFVIYNIFLSCLALVLIYNILLQQFNAIISAISTVIVGLTTNFLYYATLAPGMSHIPGLVIISLFVLSSYKFFDTKKAFWFFSAFLFLGLAILIRPSNIVFVLLYLFLDSEKPQDVILRLSMFFKQPKFIFIAIIAVFIFPFFQMLIWYLSTGNWVVYSYGEMGFNFLKPMFFSGLFGSQKGWFIYSPLLLLFIPGLFLARKQMIVQSIGFVITLFLFCWFIFSYWCWWYGGGYSIRALIEVSFIVAIGFAGIVEWVLNKPKIYRIVGIVIIPFFIGYNLIRMVQVQRTIVHPTSTSWSNLKQIGLKVNLSETEMAELNKHLSPPKPNHKK